MAVTGEQKQGYNITSIKEDSEFAKTLARLVIMVRPLNVIETGTFLGRGTTRALALALAAVPQLHSCFFTIEINPANYGQALANLEKDGLLPFVTPLYGLSVPRGLLPSKEDIQKKFVDGLKGDDVFVDYPAGQRAEAYYNEVANPQAPDDLLELCLRNCNYSPDILLLDSAGHTGFVEFQYILPKLAGTCYFVLGDTRHIKHRDSLALMKRDPRFSLLMESDEKFGFCVAKFTPSANSSGIPPMQLAVSEPTLYSRAGRLAYEGPFADICRRLGLEKKPITDTIYGPCGTYIHASKQWEYPYALSMLPDSGGGRLKIADIGGGRGVLAWYMAALGHDVTVYDINYDSYTPPDSPDTAAFVRFALENGFKAEYGDMFRLPASSETFDVVTCISVVEHIGQKQEALKEMLRILKPGGRLILTYDLAENPASHNVGFRQDVFAPEHIGSLLREFGLAVGEIYGKSALTGSMADCQADGVCALPPGLTVGGLTLTRIS